MDIHTQQRHENHIHITYIYHHHSKLGMLSSGAYAVFTSKIFQTKGIAMRSSALDIAYRSAAFLGDLIDALDKALAMSKAVDHFNPTASDLKKVRAIADTI